MKRLLKVLKLVREYEPHILFWLLLSCLTSGLAPLVNIMVPRYMLEELLGSKRITFLVITIIILSVGNLFFAALKALGKRSITVAFQNAQMRFDQRLASKSVRIPLAESESKSNLDLLERGKFGLYSFYDLDLVSQQTGAAIITLVATGIIIVLGDWKLLLLLMVFNLFTIPSMKRLQNLEVDNARRFVPENREFLYYCNVAVDYRYAKDLKIFDGIGLMLRRAEKNMNRILKTNHEYFSKFGFWNGFSGMIIEFQTVALFATLGYRLLKGEISIGTFTMIYGACRQFGQSLNQLTTNSLQLMTMGILFEPLIQYFEKGEFKDHSNAAKNEAVENCLALAREGTLNWKFDNLSFCYPSGKSNVIENCSFEIQSNETIALVGKNGAGKTSLVKLLCRFYDPQEGTIYLNGVDIRKIPLKEYYQILSPTFQDFQLLPFEIQENVACKGESELLDEDKEKIWSAITEVGLLPWVKALLNNISTFLSQNLKQEGVLPSGGQAQKIALSRSIYQNGNFVILDEPTAALDPRSEEEIFEEMLKLTQDKTCIFISHRLSSTRYADRILVMNKGKIVENGSHHSLMKHNGIYADMYEAQASQYVEANGSIH